MADSKISCADGILPVFFSPWRNLWFSIIGTHLSVLCAVCDEVLNKPCVKRALLSWRGVQKLMPASAAPNRSMPCCCAKPRRASNNTRDTSKRAPKIERWVSSRSQSSLTGSGSFRSNGNIANMCAWRKFRCGVISVRIGYIEFIAKRKVGIKMVLHRN